MSFCASCGLQLTSETALCPHHHMVYGDDWAENNRIWCDFFHRGIVPKRLTAEERDDDLWLTQLRDNPDASRPDVDYDAA